MPHKTSPSTTVQLNPEWLGIALIVLFAILAVFGPRLYLKPLTTKPATPVLCRAGGVCIDE